ncbi:N-glycosylase/DNA lyase-like [Trematomus bernacchii]|uniref:N-glycosylase/DNA lyase-like n=1 Tax=Trematomus bernacchii TaxID=40690 RepID=UPI00146F4266|nr:N-glycosylase/DNA lyase-like [Trematomus bernacchii]
MQIGQGCRSGMAKHTVLSSGAKLWRSLACAKSELRLDLTLACGQSFRWRETAEGHWTGVIGGRVWTLTQTDDTLWYHIYQSLDRQGETSVSLQLENKSDNRFKEAVKKEEEEPVAVTPVHQDTKDDEEMLRDYFQLNVKLGDLYKEWGAADHHFKHIAVIFTGIRMLRQDPTECLFSLICHNHITCIQGMVERLCQSLGAPLCQLDQTSYHNFPSLSALADTSVEARLKDLGFGYRARFLQQSAKQILDTHGIQWLEGLRSAPYLQARDALRTLPGVSPKVADCVCLMSLDKAEAVPIDTHVWQIARRDYIYGYANGQKYITGDFFRKLWGPYAGWAQSVLLCADLKKFRNLKEMLHMKRPKKKEENDEEKLTVAGKKKKLRRKKWIL